MGRLSKDNIMFGSFIRFIRRPDINEQNTGHEAYQRYNNPIYAGVNGIAGFTVQRQIKATQPANIAVGPTHKLNDPTVTGNNAETLKAEPLSKDAMTAMLESIRSF